MSLVVNVLFFESKALPTNQGKDDISINTINTHNKFSVLYSFHFDKNGN